MDEVKCQEIGTFVSQLLEPKIANRESVNWDESKPLLNFKMPIHASVWAFDPLSDAGFSGASVVSVEPSTLVCHAPSTWTIVASKEEFTVVLFLPIQEQELASLCNELATPPEVLTESLVTLKLKFVEFELLDSGARVGRYLVLGVDENASTVMNDLEKILTLRQEAYYLYGQAS